jgi:hypothetical protein
MPDLYVDVDTAVVVPVNVMPLVDDTDGKSIEPAVVYNSAGMALVWNFVTCAGASTAVAVTPTTGGNYDWGEPVANQGMYTIEIPASGGASINNDTEGVGWFTGVATGVLPWRGPMIGCRAALANDALADGTDRLQVHVAEITNDIITAAAIAAGAIDFATFAADCKTGAGLKANVESITAAAITAAAIATDAIDDDAIATGAITSTAFAAGAITAAAIAADAIGASELAADAVAEIALGVLNQPLATSDADALNARTVRSALRALRNKSTIAAGTLTVTKEDDAASAWTAAITTDAAAEPITVVDPA